MAGACGSRELRSSENSEEIASAQLAIEGCSCRAAGATIASPEQVVREVTLAVRVERKGLPAGVRVFD